MSVTLFKRDSGGRLIIAAYHPSWSLTWSWVLSWGVGGTKSIWAHRTSRYRSGLFGVIGIGRLRFERQPTMRLISAPRSSKSGWIDGSEGF